MSNPLNHSKKYSLTDIEQYLQGKLSPAEMHEMEKAAVQDPFLADAMEGFQSANLVKAEQDLAQIRLALLRKEPETAPVIKLASQRKKWLQIAAMIVLLAGSSTLAWFLFKSAPQKKEMVLQPIQKIKTDTSQSATATTLLPDTISKPKKEILAAVPVIKEKLKQKDIINSASLQKDMEIASAIKENLAETAKKSMDTVSDKMLMESAVALNKSAASVTANIGALQTNTYKSLPLSSIGTISPGAQPIITSMGQLTNLSTTGLLASGSISGVIQTAPIKIIQGKVVDVHNKPISFATVTAANQITQTDTAGIFKILVKDSIPKVKISALSFDETTAQLKVSEPNNIVLKDFSGSLNEVVVTGYSAQKRKDLTGSVSTKKEAAQAGSSSSFYPENGWDDLVIYVKNKLKSDLSDKVHNGDVKVKLSVNMGKIINAEVLESFNQSINRKLIRALKKGPKWISNDSSLNEQTHIVIIHL